MGASFTPAHARRFDQTALATPANFLTVARIIVGVPTLVLMSRHGASWLAVTLWFLITSTDSLDGFLARRDGATRSGAFLDPVADKLLVLGAFAVLAQRGDISWWPVAVIAAREVFVSAYRALAGRRGISLPARPLGKYKAFFQYLSIGAVLLPWTADEVGLQQTVLGLVVTLTVVSAADIVHHGWRDWQRDGQAQAGGGGTPAPEGTPS
jgi:CDP-diacylglycerol--glycerol-3-phosphate 3-phosphatidyltransferase